MASSSLTHWESAPIFWPLPLHDVPWLESWLCLSPELHLSPLSCRPMHRLPSLSSHWVSAPMPSLSQLIFAGQPPHHSSAPSPNTLHTGPCLYARIDYVHLNTITHGQKEQDQQNKKVCFLSHISTLVHHQRFLHCSRQRCSSFPPRCLRQ